MLKLPAHEVGFDTGCIPGKGSKRGIVHTGSYTGHTLLKLPPGEVASSIRLHTWQRL